MFITRCSERTSAPDSTRLPMTPRSAACFSYRLSNHAKKRLTYHWHSEIGTVPNSKSEAASCARSSSWHVATRSVRDSASKFGPNLGPLCHGLSHRHSRRSSVKAYYFPTCLRNMICRNFSAQERFLNSDVSALSSSKPCVQL